MNFDILNLHNRGSANLGEVVELAQILVLLWEVPKDVLILLADPASMINCFSMESRWCFKVMKKPVATAVVLHFVPATETVNKLKWNGRWCEGGG